MEDVTTNTKLPDTLYECPSRTSNSVTQIKYTDKLLIFHQSKFLENFLSHVII